MMESKLSYEKIAKFMRRTADAGQKSSGTGITFVVLHMEILLGYAKEIISVDVYGDTQEIIEDCLDILESFIEEVIPKERKNQFCDFYS